MLSKGATIYGGAVTLLLVLAYPILTLAQEQVNDEEFGPVVRAYLGYLRGEQEVVDDRASRHEIDPAYYRRNSDRIRALREMAVRLARQTRNDYLPELEAVARDEFGQIFEKRPRIDSLRVGDVVENTFRFLGAVRSGEAFYVFARLDPYEKAELMEKAERSKNPKSSHEPAQGAVLRPRRISP